jgi:hypothetical protein
MTENRDPDGVEARLRASLHAYAEVVDDGPPVRRPSLGAGGGTPRSSAVRRWRAPALVAAAVLAVAGGAWLVLDPAGAPSPTAAPASATADSAPEAAAAQPPSAADSSGARSSEDEVAAAEAGSGGELVVRPPVEVGVTYPFDLYTHCGIHGADVGGDWFAADPPLVEVGANPPAGWGNPYQRGTLTLESTDVAVFRDDAGHELTLRAAQDERPPPCD